MGGSDFRHPGPPRTDAILSDEEKVLLKIFLAFRQNWYFTEIWRIHAEFARETDGEEIYAPL